VDHKSAAFGPPQVERRVLVDGKWLRDGKRSDAGGPAPVRDCVQISIDPPHSELVEDLFSDAKDLIRELTYGCNEKESSTNPDSLAGVDDRIINKILTSFSPLDSPGSEPLL
jgi:hypothetical protein